jgi:hypothetical protein
MTTIGFRVVRRWEDRAWIFAGPEDVSLHKTQDAAWLKAIKNARKNGGAAMLYDENGEAKWLFTKTGDEERLVEGRDLKARAKRAVHHSPLCRTGGGNGAA